MNHISIEIFYQSRFAIERKIFVNMTYMNQSTVDISQLYCTNTVMIGNNKILFHLIYNCIFTIDRILYIYKYNAYRL